MKRILWGAIAGLALAAGCSSENVLGPENELMVSNTTDHFQFQATALDNVSQSLSQSWQMTGDQANVGQLGTLSGGSATLTIRDAAGVEVYTRSLAQPGTFQTTAGASPGTWTITVSLKGATGTVNFKVDKP